MTSPVRGSADLPDLDDRFRDLGPHKSVEGQATILGPELVFDDDENNIGSGVGTGSGVGADIPEEKGKQKPEPVDTGLPYGDPSDDENPESY